jgi:hypothetical protein
VEAETSLVQTIVNAQDSYERYSVSTTHQETQNVFGLERSSLSATHKNSPPNSRNTKQPKQGNLCLFVEFEPCGIFSRVDRTWCSDKRTAKL